MASTFTIWVTTPPLGDVALRWIHHFDTPEGGPVTVRGQRLDDDGRGAARFRVVAESEDEAIALVREVFAEGYGEAVAAGLEFRTLPLPDDDPDWDEEDLADEGELRWVRAPCPWSEYDIADEGRRLRIAYDGGRIAEVIVAETPMVVAISLFERELVGALHDGSVVAQAAIAEPACLAIELELPVRTRRVIDGTTGETARRVDGTAWRDCPLWVP